MARTPATGAGAVGGRPESDRAGQRLLAHGRIPHPLPRPVRRDAAADAGDGATAIGRRVAASGRHPGHSTEPGVNQRSASFRRKPLRLRRQRAGATDFALGIGVQGMIKLNRIGNKLGLAGAIGVLLAAGMVANQMMSEAAVEAANGRVARSQRVIDSVLASQIQLRQMQVAARDIRLAKTSEEVDKGVADLQRLKGAQAKEVDAALAAAQLQATRDRLSKVKS